MTYERGGRVIADEKEIEFHPRSFEATVMRHYNDALGRFGLDGFAERDVALAGQPAAEALTLAA